MADEINGSETLEDTGIFAEVDGNDVSTNGTVTDSTVNDPGINHGAGAAPVPALSAWGLVVLCLMLMALGGWRLLGLRRIA